MIICVEQTKSKKTYMCLGCGVVDNSYNSMVYENEGVIECNSCGTPVKTIESDTISANYALEIYSEYISNWRKGNRKYTLDKYFYKLYGFNSVEDYVKDMQRIR